MQKWLNVAKLFCNKKDITLSINAGNVPSTNGKVIYLPALPKLLKADHRNQLLWWLIHESNHINDTDFGYDYSTSKYPLTTIHRMSNSFEDLRIDAKRIINERNLLMYFSGRVRLLNEENASREDPFALTYAVSVIPLAQSHHLECGNIHSAELQKTLETYLQQADSDLYEKVIKACETLRDRIKAMCQDENSETKHAVELAEEYLDLIDCFEKKPDEDQSEESNESEAGDGESDDDSEGDESNESEAGDGESDDDSEGDESDESEAGNGESDDDSEGDENKESTILEFEDDDASENEDHPMAPDLSKLVEEIEADEDYENVPLLGFTSSWTGDFDIIEKTCPSNLPRFHQIMSDLNREAYELETHLEDLLSDLVNSKETFKESGRFNHKSIKRYINRRDDAFVNVERQELPARHLSILIDVSGSMGSLDNEGRSRIVAAISAAGLLLPALDIIDASYSVTTFGEGVHVVKAADELTEVGLARLGALEDVVAGSTPMGDALQLTLENTPATAESHDVLIITDGCPDDANLVNVHADYGIQEGVTTHILSVGVDPTWASNQINAVYAEKIDELSQSLIELIENIILAE